MHHLVSTDTFPPTILDSIFNDTFFLFAFLFKICDFLLQLMGIIPDILFHVLG